MSHRSIIEIPNQKGFQGSKREYSKSDHQDLFNSFVTILKEKHDPHMSECEIGGHIFTGVRYEELDDYDFELLNQYLEFMGRRENNDLDETDIKSIEELDNKVRKLNKQKHTEFLAALNNRIIADLTFFVKKTYKKAA